MYQKITWRCTTCADHPTLQDIADLKEHLVEVHHLTNTRGTKTPSMFMDGKGFHMQVYAWDIEGVELVETVTLTNKEPGS